MKVQRINEIEDYIFKNKIVSLNALCIEFNVSKNTIRRDIKILCERGTIEKVYGGVKASNSSNSEAIFSKLNLNNSNLKEVIARKAAEFIDDGDNIFIDSGTTTIHILDFLKEKRHINIFTNNLKIIMKALSYENITIITLPGSLNRANYCFTDHNTYEFLKYYNINKCFMSCNGITENFGISNEFSDEFEIKRLILQKSQKKFLLADNSKFGFTSLINYALLNDFTTLITDVTPSQKYVDFCLNNNIFISLANSF